MTREVGNNGIECNTLLDLQDAVWRVWLIDVERVENVLRLIGYCKAGREWTPCCLGFVEIFEGVHISRAEGADQAHGRDGMNGQVGCCAAVEAPRVTEGRLVQ